MLRAAALNCWASIPASAVEMGESETCPTVFLLLVFFGQNSIFITCRGRSETRVEFYYPDFSSKFDKRGTLGVSFYYI